MVQVTLHVTPLKNNFESIEKKIDLSFQDKDVLLLSFVHRSYVNENKKIIDKHNERLEFLGDTVLNLIVSSYLYNKLTCHSEGKLSHIRSLLINAQACSKYYKKYEMGKYVVDSTTLYVSRGIGMEGTGAPRARFLCPPEIVVVDIK